jgi:ethanolamine utilization protein EutN
MNLGRILGNVVSTRKVEGLEGIKLMVVQPLDDQRQDMGAPEVACDTVGVGPGEVVFLVGGREASVSLPDPFVPVDLTIVGKVDPEEGKKE